MSGTEYAYSMDQEEFHGPVASPEYALDQAMQRLAEDHEPGSTMTVFVGEVKRPQAFLSVWAKHIGAQVLEEAENYLVDQIYSDSNVIELQPDQASELGELIFTYLRNNAKFNRFCVINIRPHEVTVPGDEEGAHP